MVVGFENGAWIMDYVNFHDSERSASLRAPHPATTSEMPIRHFFLSTSALSSVFLPTTYGAPYFWVSVGWAMWP